MESYQMCRPERSKRYAYYVVAVLGLTSALNFYDRNVLGIILQPMKKDLRLSDMQAGLLSGVAFAVVYSLLGLPIARIADRGRKVQVLSSALAFWSVMTAACGFATNAAGLFFARMGVGAGEAGGLPSTHAIIADYFPPEQRGKALTAIAVASSIGVICGLSIGGFVSDRFGWRAAFWVGGPPGVLLAILTFLSVREPGPGLIGRNPSTQTSPHIPIASVLNQLRRRSSYVLTVAALTLAQTAGFAQLAWAPTFFIRAFGLKPGQVGLLFALVSVVPGIIAMVCGSFIVELWTRRDKRATIWFLMLTFSAAIPAGFATFLAPNLYIAIVGVFASALINNAYVGPNYALIQGLSGPRLRATGAAIYMAVVTLFALSVGPAVAGFLIDHLAPTSGANSLRWALCIVGVFYLASLPVFMLAARTVETDLNEAEGV
jgi:MFS family permease